VIIYTLHISLCIPDNLTDLLIQDLKAQDNLDRKRRIKHNMTNLEMYETHLNKKCKIHFKWFEDTKELKYRDLIDPKKFVFLKTQIYAKNFHVYQTMTKSNNYGVIFSPLSMK